MTCPDLVYEVILVVLWFERRVKRVFMRETSWKYIRSGGNCALGRHDDGLPHKSLYLWRAPSHRNEDYKRTILLFHTAVYPSFLFMADSALSHRAAVANTFLVTENIQRT